VILFCEQVIYLVTQLKVVADNRDICEIRQLRKTKVYSFRQTDPGNTFSSFYLFFIYTQY